MMEKEWRGRATVHQAGPQFSFECELKFDPTQGPEGAWSGTFTPGTGDLKVGDAELIVNGEVVAVRITEAPRYGEEGAFVGVGRPPSI